MATSKVFQCPTAVVHGNVSLGANVIIHPNAKIESLDGASIRIGDDCIIEEGVVIECRSGELLIGQGNLLEVRQA
jgi:carbonic anhydrase/acetyltransferase-like protein (isoleucine patch superfamily)